MVELTQRAIHIFEIVKQVEIGVLSVEEACEKLGRSRSVVYEYLKKIREEGVESLNYQSHPAWNRSDSKIEKQIIALKEQRVERSAPLICHLMKNRHGKTVYPSTIKRILARSQIHFVRNCSKEPIKPYEMKHFGDMWQMDTFERKCIPNHPKIYIVIIVDDYARPLLAGMGFTRDSTANNMLVLRLAIEYYGVPHSIKVDNDTKFHPTQGKNETELVRACRELGCIMFCHKPFNPKSKGKVEHRIQYLDDWFIKENKFKDLPDFNNKFSKHHAWFNTHFIIATTGTTPAKRMKPSTTKPISKGLNLDDVFCIKAERFVKRDCTIHYKSKKYIVGKKYIGEKVQLHIVGIC